MDEVRNFGVILGQRDTDWMVGAIQYEERNPSGDWTPYLPPGEWQKDLQTLTDTMACVTFSALNSLEAQYKFLTGESINFSDRFTATMSGTTQQGNWLWKVGDSIRNDGLVKEELWPAPSKFTWGSYYSPVDINVINAGKKFLESWTVNYEQFTPVTRESLMKELKHSPIQVVIPGHAVLNFYTTAQVQKYFDSYSPFVKEYNPDFQVAMKYVLKKKDNQDMVTLQNIDRLYQIAFHRLADAAGKAFWVGKTIDQFLDGVLNSEEFKNYDPLFKAGKQIEEWARP